MSLHTLAHPVSHTVDIKHSRFTALAAAVDHPAAALAHLQAVATPDATHNCWAWRIGGDYRSSDDGEPAGTAGRPILAAIDGQGYDRVMVVVTRWYGGIKLGAGGLVRAYGGAAAECLRLADRLPLIATIRLRLHVPFADLGTVHLLLPVFHADKQGERFDADGAWIDIELPIDQVDSLRPRLRDATRNRVRIDDNSGDGQHS